jgi:ribonucleoside-diphosphate reductase alpha chain
MDYLFRWLELRFLSEKQLALFVATSADGESTVSASSKASSSVSQFRQDSYEAGDAPLCTTRGSLMVPNGSGYKCSNCGGTSCCS